MLVILAGPLMSHRKRDWNRVEELMKPPVTGCEVNQRMNADNSVTLIDHLESNHRPALDRRHRKRQPAPERLQRSARQDRR